MNETLTIKMRIHNFHRKGSASGDDQVFKSETALLESHGNQVIRYTVSNDEFDNAGVIGKLSATFGMLWSSKNYKAVQQLIQKEKPDIVHDCWIGSNVTILDGVTIGKGSVIGAGTLMTKDIPADSIIVDRAISEEQLVYKTCCYTMRDIATMGNNIETAQRTNQLAKIESGISMHDAAIEASYAGYPKEITENQIDLSFCEPGSLTIKYSELSSESIAERIMRTGQEMAILEKLKISDGNLNTVLRMD